MPLSHLSTETNSGQHVQAVVLLDIDGVLNPRLIPVSTDHSGAQERLVLSPARAEFVRQLAAMGRLVWVSTWPSMVAHRLACDLGITAAGRVPLKKLDPRLPTPKLPAVQRWVERMEATEDIRWDLLVWIDDELAADAFTWAQQQKYPTMLLRTRAHEGLQNEHLQSLRQKIAQIQSQLER